jgi:uncharacterized membrane protein YfcA
MSSITIYVVSVIFLATLVRSTFGFGEALIAVPLLALRIPIEVSAPLAVLLSITVAAVAIVQDWRKIHLRSASWLVGATLFGIPLGLLLLTHGNTAYVKTILGLLIILFAVYSLAVRLPIVLQADSRPALLLCGFLAGILGGAYGLNGPPLVVYAAMRRWSAQHFRATLQAYFLPASLITAVGYALTGLLTRSVTHYYLMSLLPSLIAVVIGRALNHRLQGDSFLRYVYLGLAAIGTLLLLQGLHVSP